MSKTVVVKKTKQEQNEELVYLLRDCFSPNKKKRDKAKKQLGRPITEKDMMLLAQELEAFEQECTDSSNVVSKIFNELNQTRPNINKIRSWVGLNQ